MKEQSVIREVHRMDYIRATEILPQELIEQLQEYVDGAAVYIPKKRRRRKLKKKSHNLTSKFIWKN